MAPAGEERAARAQNDERGSVRLDDASAAPATGGKAPPATEACPASAVVAHTRAIGT